MEVALEAGAEDMTDSGDMFEVATPPDMLHEVKDALEAASVRVESAELSMVPQSTVDLGGKDADATLKLLEALDDADDVQSVSANFEIDQEELERITAA
jgi:transcriptional/translational regulatory protein YebC/TACO1